MLPLALLFSRAEDRGLVWAFVAFGTFLFGVATYAFGRAARAQTVRCERRAQGLVVTARGQTVTIAAADATLEAARVPGHSLRPPPVYAAILKAPQLPQGVMLHCGLTHRGAARAAARIRAHLGL